ncbi:hypothetical protein GQ457_01G019270 [Hibiscus cannabinus]
MFYNGVNAPTRMMLDASANGTLLDKSPEEAFEILDRIANNDYQFPTSRLGSGRRTSGKLELDANDSVSAQLSAITNILKNLQKPSDVREAKALSCIHCEGNHHATDCPVMHEQASYLGNYNRNSNNPYSNTYNPDPTPSNEQKEPEDVIDSSIEEDKGEKLDTEKTEEQHKHKEDLQFQKFVSMLDQFHINIPVLEAIEQVPSYAKFLKDIVTKKRRADNYETVDVASEYCAGRVEIPIKKKDPGSFIIPCSIGNNFMGNALCDLGSSFNLMPKAVFKKLGIGIERPTTVILQLADRSHVRPEGKIEDVIVKVGKFVFPVDFLILDCEVDDKASIILGRPFLATRRILIDYEKGDFTMRVADQTMTINVFNTLQYMDNQGDCYHLREEHTTASEEESDMICCSNNETLPVIISSKLLPDQECSLINLLSQYKKNNRLDYGRSQGNQPYYLYAQDHAGRMP